jgi:hypothetical protein
VAGVPKANWFTDVDVHAPPPGQTTIESVGKPIDLRGAPALNQRLIELVNMEGVLHQRGITCPIKDREDSTCSACPVRAERPSDQLHSLCQLGRAQERVATELAVLRVNGAE